MAHLFSLKTIVFSLGFSLALTSCASMPGMRYTKKVETEVVNYEQDGQKVKLVPVPLAVGNKKSEAPTEIPAELLNVKPAPYVIGPHDVLTIVVWEHPELTTPLGQFRSDNASGQIVADDGTFYFPYAGRMKVAGLTVLQVRDMVTKRLATVLKDPQVDVKVMDYRSKKVFIAGEVNAPGVYPMDDIALNLAETLHRAGGFTSTADAGKVYLSRRGKTYELDVMKIYEEGSRISQILMQPGDLLRVPSNNERQVYVMGEVLRPKTVAMNHGRLSLVQALADAGGPSMITADAGAIYVIRFQDTKEIEVFHLNADNPLALAVGDQFALQPKDVIYVDPAGITRWNRFITNILPTVNMLSTGANSAARVYDATK